MRGLGAEKEEILQLVEGYSKYEEVQSEERV
jgi:hypothetical protein